MLNDKDFKDERVFIFDFLFNYYDKDYNESFKELKLNTDEYNVLNRILNDLNIN